MSAIGAIIAARMGSRRLPGKVLMPLGGKPMLEWVIDGVLQSRVERVVVLVTPDPQDDAIMELCSKLGIDTFVGSDNRDVLGDFYNVATEFGFDPIVRVTADCPLISPLTINSVVNEYLKGCDYCSNIVTRTYPRGLDTEVFSYAMLAWMQENLTPEHPLYDGDLADYRKHVTLYIRENYQSFNIRNTTVDLSRIRLTVDTQDEYDKLDVVFDLMDDDPNWLDAVKIMNDNPELATMETPESQTKALGKVW